MVCIVTLNLMSILLLSYSILLDRTKRRMDGRKMKDGKMARRTEAEYTVDGPSI